MPVTRLTLHWEHSLDRDMYIESGHFYCLKCFSAVPKLSEREVLEDPRTETIREREKRMESGDWTSASSTRYLQESMRAL